GIAVLFVTHDQSEAMVLSDRIAVMQAGRIEQVGSPVAVYERPATPFVRDFLGRVVMLEIAPSSSDPRRAEVPGEPGAAFELPAHLPVEGGAGRLILACRPEDVRIQVASALSINELGGTVETAAYLGEHIEYAVRTVGGRLLLVLGPRRERVEPGATVSLRIDTTEATFWAP
ncbi:MAG: TOBE domain-containing protein, partial [Chloroflexi bacterium]|nr:TOBE domain-containing protein [Chloroflexota bacterium]